VRQNPYYFEIKDMLTQFVAAFDDIVIKRFNVNRKIEDRISVRYVYSPKQRVLYDIINTAKRAGENNKARSYINLKQHSLKYVLYLKIQLTD